MTYSSRNVIDIWPIEKLSPRLYFIFPVTFAFVREITPAFPDVFISIPTVLQNRFNIWKERSLYISTGRGLKIF
jgi:hypothetical protein